MGRSMTQNDRQRARRDRVGGGTAARRALHERERRVELLVAEVLNTLSQRDVLVAGLERRAGRCLVEIHDLGWPGSVRVAAACDLSVREVARLRKLASEEDPQVIDRNRSPGTNDIGQLSEGPVSVSDSEVTEWPVSAHHAPPTEVRDT
jgi:hypothetical protein